MNGDDRVEELRGELRKASSFRRSVLSNVVANLVAAAILYLAAPWPDS